MSNFILSLLGRCEAQRDGALVDFTTDKARALLAYLAVEHTQAHRRDYLAALLWPDQPEARARHNLRQALSSLRQALGDSDDLPTPWLLVTRESVQCNPAAPLQIDVAEFVALCTVNRQHRHRRADACFPCLRRMERLADLYRGDFLAQFHLSDSELFEEWALLKREWLHREALEALVALSDFYERRGDTAIARAYTQRQLTLDPWREEAHRQLMQLLALDGERSAALAQYETCRRILATEFRAEPAAETVELGEHINKSSNQQISKAANQPPAPLLPLPPSPFVGRDVERAELAELLARPDCRLVTLVGPGGIGKSRLALQVAEDHRGIFSDGVAFVSLAALTQGDTLLHAIAKALLPPAAPHDARALLAQLRTQELLLVLDNFEQLVAYCDPLCTLLHHARSLTVLVTSREKLRLQEEWVYPVEGLPYPETPCADPTSYSALALFQQRATQAQHWFELTPEVLPHVITICRLVQGLPLGIELAAAAAAEQSCAEIATALAHTFDTLGNTLRNAPPRHRSLRAAFEHSWNLLTPTLQQHFATLAVFVESFDSNAAREIAHISPTALSALTAKSLLIFDGTRYHWHQATHQYAAEQLERDAAQAWLLRTRHSAIFAARVAQCTTQLHTRAAATALITLERDRGNLQAAWQWATAQRDIDTLLQLTPGLSTFYRRRGPAEEGVTLFAATLEQLPQHAQSTQLLAQLRAEHIQLLNLMTRYEEALASVATWLQQRELTPPHTALAYFLQGQTLQRQGKSETAQDILEKSLALTQTISGTEGQQLEAKILSEMGNSLMRRGKQAESLACYERALALCQTLADLWSESGLRNNLGNLYYDMGDYSAAREQLTHALRLYRELGNLPGEAKALNNIANIAADQRDYSYALQAYQQALEIHRTSGNSRAQSSALNNLGALDWELGRYTAARESYRRALALHRESGNRQAEGETLANLSLLELRLDNPHGALALAQAALRASKESADVSNLANVYTYLGKIHAALSQWDAAEREYRQALTLREALPHAGRQLELHAELAHITYQRGHAHQALAEIEPVLAALEAAPALDGAEEPYQVYWICHEILRANNDTRATALLATAQYHLQQQANSISALELRRSFLENTPACRRLMKERET